MYCAYHGFTEKPFNITPDPAFIFLSRNHQEAFAHLLYGIDSHVGFIELTGEVGTGKTTVLRTLLNQLDAKNYRTAIIFNPCLSSSGLLQSINREFGIPYQNLNDQELIDTLNQFLVAQNATGNTVVLVIDEAQNLKQEVLEQIRLISNLETERDKLIQIVLAGQPELKQLLAQPSLRQLNQRIMVRYHLSPMDLDDTGDYINHRLKVAGRMYAEIFTVGALRKIYRFSGGFPRLINIVCDRALLLGYTKGRREISSGMAVTAIKDVRQTEKTSRLTARFNAVAILVISLLLVTIILVVPQYFSGRENTRNFIAATVAPQAKPDTSTANFPEALRIALTGTTESESAQQGLNVLAKLWRVPNFPTPPKQSFELDLERIAAERSLQFYRFNGSLGALVRMNTPALLELTLPGVNGKRFLAVTRAESDRYYINMLINGRDFITGSELDSVWSGRSFLLWKNYRKIPPGLRDGASGEAVKQLQSLLAQASAYHGPLTGVFDQSTVAAIKHFQTEQGIETDGLAGNQTLLLLYRSTGSFFSPELMQRGRRQE
jgi:general secretion pathway protein A